MPLYTVAAYSGADSVVEPTAAFGRRQWRAVGLTDAIFQCRNGTKSEATVYFLWEAQKKNNPQDRTIWHFQKVGQYPPIQEAVDSDLETELDESDLNWSQWKPVSIDWKLSWTFAVNRNKREPSAVESDPP